MERKIRRALIAAPNFPHSGLQWNLAESFEGLSGVAKARGDPRRAAHLLAAATSLRPSDRAEFDDPSLLAAFEEGKAMSMDQAIRYALETDEPDP